MIFMSTEERRAYLTELRPYLKISLTIFAGGIVSGLMILAHFPEIADYFQSSLAGFVQMFRSMPKLQLAAAIFLNNAVKTVAAMLLGCLFGVLPGFMLLANGAALGLVFSVSTQTRGLWISLLSIVPHGVLELPAVFLSTSIGFMLGVRAARSLFRKSENTLGAEMIRGLKFFFTVIAPLLLIAALIEAFVTSMLVAPR